MAAGMPTSYALEIEFTAGVWTDVSADVDFTSGVLAQFGRTREGELVAPSSLNFSLFNPAGDYTPDNPTGTYYPNVTERKGVRLKVTKGSTRTRFTGVVQSWKPVIPVGGSAAQSMVFVSCASVDAAANRSLLSRWAESIMVADPDAHVWPLDEPAGAVAARNLNTSGVPAVRVNSSALSTVEQSGSASFGGSPDRVALDGVVSFEPAGKGPVLVFPYVNAPDPEGVVAFWVRVSELPSADKTIYSMSRRFGTGVSGTSSVKIESSGALSLHEGGSFVADLATGADDGRWRLIVIDFLNTASAYCYTEGEADPAEFLGAVSLGSYVDSVHTFGGAIDGDPYSGLQTDCATFELGGFAVLTDIANLPAINIAGDPWPVAYTLSETADQIASFAGFTITPTGTEDPVIGHANTIGRTYHGALQQAATAAGAIAWVKPDGTHELRKPDAARTTTPVLTFDIETDGNGELETSREVDSIPTRATVTYGTGTVTSIDTTAETDGFTLEATAEAYSADLDQATYLADFLLAENATLRINKVGLSLSGGVNDNYAEAAALYPGARVRIENLPSEFFGYTQTDVVVQGWTERYAVAGVDVVLDCSPADSPRNSLIETDDDAVAATDTTLNGNLTSSTTTVTLATVTDTWSTSAGDYPLNIKIDGEIITVPSAPASATAPSWTGCTRGVGGTIAVAHTTGASVDVHHPQTVAF